MNLRELIEQQNKLLAEYGEDLLDEPVYHDDPRNAALKTEVVQVTVDPLWGYVRID